MRLLSRLSKLPGFAPVAALVLGGLAALAFAPVGWHILALLSLAGLLGLLHGKHPRQGFKLAWLFGLGLFSVGVSWIYISLTLYGGMPFWLGALATLLFCAVVALFPALAGWLTLKLCAPNVQPTAQYWLLVFPAIWTLTEWLRGWLFTGFPWLAMGYAQGPQGSLAGYAPVLGVYGVTWLTAVCSGLLVWLMRDAWLPGKWLVPFALLVGLLGAGEGLKYIEWTRPIGTPVSVALVQGNIAQDMKWRPEKAAQTLSEYAAQLRSSDAKLIVLPETALPMFYSDLPDFYLSELRARLKARHADALIGVPTGKADGDYYNSVASLGTSPTQFYHKQHLVAFGEFVPRGFGWIINVLHIPLSDFARGEKYQQPLSVAGQRVAVNICYEDGFGEEIIRALPDATLLANVTNDAWFGDSFAGWQHAQMSQMRALETGRFMLRATNTGVTAIIDQKGRVVSALPEFAQGTLHGQAQGYSGATPYVRWGNWPVIVLMLAMLGWFALRRRPQV